MAAKKKTASVAKKTGSKQASAKKTGPKKASAKSSGAKKAAAKKKSSPKKAGAKKAAAKKKAAPVKADGKPDKKAGKKTSSAKAAITSAEVNLGHVFALRPRVNTSFRPNDFMSAKRALREETYSTLADAARAVAEEALEITRGAASKSGPLTR